MGKLIDLTGQRVGRWLVLGKSDKKDSSGHLMWECECSCDKHTKRAVSGHSLRHKKSLSCGCLTAERRKEVEQEKETTDLIGVTRGVFTAKEYLGNNIWKCECNLCHNTIELSRNKFLSGKLKSCGCLDRKVPFEHLEGKTFGLWHVESYAGNSKWNCVCECGTRSQVSTNKLLTNKSTKCKKHKNKNNIIYPKWFIDDLKDKSLVGKINTHDIVDFVCPIHGVYKQRVGDHIRLSDNSRRFGCPHCSNNLAFAGSKPENYIADFIANNFPDLQILRHDRKALEGKEIDIYLPQIAVGIEYNGSWCHASENGVYDDKNKYYHQNKFLQAKDNGIHLISVFDFQYKDHKWELLENIRHILSGNKNFFIPHNIIEYTDNNYDTGTWLLSYGYEYVGQEEPVPHMYKNFIVYDCGRTIWKLKEGVIA